MRWAQSARRHRIGKPSARYVMNTVSARRTTSLGGARACVWVGADERGRELEIIAVEIDPLHDEPYLLVVHVMPTQLKGQTP